MGTRQDIRRDNEHQFSWTERWDILDYDCRHYYKVSHHQTDTLQVQKTQWLLFALGEPKNTLTGNHILIPLIPQHPELIYWSLEWTNDHKLPQQEINLSLHLHTDHKLPCK